MNSTRIARWNLLFALVFAIIGMLLGIYMASSKNHTQHVTHAHILLLGFVVSVIYAVIYRLWLTGSGGIVAKLQTGLHEIGVIMLSGGLFMLYGQRMSEEQLGPFLGIGSFAVLISVVMMLVQVAIGERPSAAVSPGAVRA